MKLYGLEIPFVEAVELTGRHTQIFSAAGCSSCLGVCCRHCAENDGYLRQDLYLSDAEIDDLKQRYAWSSTHGVRGGFGCQLPPTHRSPTCVAYYCGSPGSLELVADVQPLAVGLHLSEQQLATVLPEIQAFRELLTDLVNDPTSNPPR